MKADSRKFLFAGVILFSVLFSLFIWVGRGHLKRYSGEIHIAVAGPSGMDDAVRLYFGPINERGGIRGRKIVVDYFDDRNDPKTALEKAKDIARRNQALAVIGHSYSSCSLSAGRVYKTFGIPAITPQSTSTEVTLGNRWYFRTLFNDTFQGRFLANYAKQVLKENSASIIHDSGTYGACLAREFERASASAGLDIGYKRMFDKTERSDAVFKRIARELKGRRGTVFIATHAEQGAAMVKAMREAGIGNKIVAPDAFSSKSFLDWLKAHPQAVHVPGHYADGIYANTPLMLDTANEKAQDFRRKYRNAYGRNPNWSHFFSYDTAMILHRALEETGVSGEQGERQAERKKIRDWLAALDSPEKGLLGTTGLNYFDENGDCPGKSVSVGTYRNGHFMSALGQFSPIQYPERIPNIEGEIREGRILRFGDDSHMYETNVVYTGVEMARISEIDVAKSSCLLDFHIWFRYRNEEFDVRNVEFLNTLDPVVLEAPGKRKAPSGTDATRDMSADAERRTSPLRPETEADLTGEDDLSPSAGGKAVEAHAAPSLGRRSEAEPMTAELVRQERMGDMRSVLYRIRARFANDFENSSPQGAKGYYVGFRFRHRYLSRNNLIYVADLFGMDMENESSFLKRMRDAGMLASEGDWVLDHGAFSQDTVRRSTMGGLNDLGLPRKSQDHSQFTFKVSLKKDTLPGRIPKDLAFWMTVGSCAAMALLFLLSGSRRLGVPAKLAWTLKTMLGLLLLVNAEAFLIKGPLENMSAMCAELVVHIFDSFYWLVPAIFLHLALGPFVWEAIERQSGRPVPRVLRRLPAYLIYFVAGYGIVVSVFGLNINRIMATSGALAMGIGLMVKDNIANYFASITILQGYEIRIGHWVKIGGFGEGRVQEVTRMTTRIVRRDGSLLSVPNSVVLDSVVVNHSHPNDVCRLSFDLETVPEHSPLRVRRILEAAALAVSGVLKEPGPLILFRGQGDSSAKYTVTFCVGDYGGKPDHLTAVWESVWIHLEKAGVDLATPHRVIHLLDETPERSEA